jgi:hypothetical protein
VLVPWHCPACRTTIQHNALEDRPRSGEIYRCHVCRLSLEFDEGSNKLIVAPLDFDGDGEQRSRLDNSDDSTSRRRPHKPRPK